MVQMHDGIAAPLQAVAFFVHDVKGKTKNIEMKANNKDFMFSCFI